MDISLEYACKRIQELESLLLVDVPETVWPAEVAMVLSEVENAGELPAHHQRRLQHHINRMWLEKMPVPSIIAAARSQASAMEKYARERAKSSLITLLVAVVPQRALSWRLVAAWILRLTTIRTQWQCTLQTTRIRCTTASRFTKSGQRLRPLAAR